ncbi:hypothetical protein [Tenacibaculum sp. 190524A02b]|uniref:hypothetical protein n=1 Tax=Tenacibaculum vairaonense TaxID=3137860 RepID=UPI0031FB844D
MTVQDLINLLSNNSSVIINYYVVLLVISLCGLLFITNQNFKKPINYIYSVLIYAAVIPGLLSVILVVYSFFFLRKNLIHLEIITYYLPIIAMIVLLLIIKKTIPLQRIPGFDRLSGLFIIIFIAFIITYFIQKIFIGIFFIGSITHLLGIFIVLLILLKIGWNKFVK